MTAQLGRLHYQCIDLAFLEDLVGIRTDFGLDSFTPLEYASMYQAPILRLIM